MSVQPFRIEISQATLNDLRERLARTRWPDEVRDAGWEYGANLGYMKQLVTYWQNTFDWRAQEAAINQFAQFRAAVDGRNRSWWPTTCTRSSATCGTQARFDAIAHVAPLRLKR